MNLFEHILSLSLLEKLYTGRDHFTHLMNDLLHLRLKRIQRIVMITVSIVAFRLVLSRLPVVKRLLAYIFRLAAMLCHRLAMKTPLSTYLN